MFGIIMIEKLPAVAIALFLLSLATFAMGQSTTVSSQSKRQLAPQSKETTTADFVRLVVMRLIFGLASAMGYGESLSNFLGGIFVPPGADYDDDYDFIPDLF